MNASGESPRELAWRETPYLDALLGHVEADVLGFHIPGHQQGRGAPARLSRLLGEPALAADLTQVLGMDDVHRPISVCGQAQRLMAELYGADRSYFLVNGSTSGNQAMLLATLGPGRAVLVPRNAHRSVMGGLILCGARPIYYEPAYDREMRVYHAPTPEVVQQALEANSEVSAVFVTTPTYYGVTAEVATLAELVHAHGLPLLVDEAWGAHLPFHPRLPLSAVEAGADLVVHGVHKVLAGLTQSAALHMRGPRVDRERLESVLSLLSSTSPSCLLLASLDAARQQMATAGHELLERALELADQARRKLKTVPGLRCYGQEITSRPGVAGWDPTRIVVSAADQGISGYEIERYLRADHNLQIEMADAVHALAVIGAGHSPDQVERLVQGLAAVPREARRDRLEQPPPAAPLPVPEQSMTPREAFCASWEAVSLESALGRVSTETISVYPPGIPMLCPGEVVGSDVLERLRREQAAGASLQGAVDPRLKTLRVVKHARRSRGNEMR